MVATPIPTITPLDTPHQQAAAWMVWVACESSITLIDGPNGELFFRGYAIEDLAEAAMMVQAHLHRTNHQGAS